MEIRSARRGDVPAIAAIQAACPMAAQWDAASYLDYDCSVAVLDEKIVGFLVSRQTVPGQQEILNIAVAPEMQRHGIARELLKQKIDSRPDQEWFLEVRESNVPALKLYQQLGFSQIGRREKYYATPLEAAIVMRFFSCYCHGAQSAVGDRLS